jgi:hypothetical protein
MIVRRSCCTLIAITLLPACGPMAAQSLNASTSMLLPQVRALHGDDFLGCPYPSGRVWQTNISNAPVNKNSAAYIAATIAGGGGGDFQIWAPNTNEYINDATDSTPMVKVYGYYGWQHPYSPIPFEPDFYIEPSGDAHLLILQTQDCRYYEGYLASYVNEELSEYGGGRWLLKEPFHRPPHGALSTSTGIPIALLAIRPEELSAGIIQHALGWNAVSYSLSETACVSPAGKTDCTDGHPYAGPASDTPMPYGSHARLMKSFDISSFPREAKIVATALQTYGMYIYDTGCCNTIVAVDDSFGAPTWTSEDEEAIETISPSNLEIVNPP